MKNAKREVVERLVSLNYAELAFVKQLVRNAAKEQIANDVGNAVRSLIYRVEEKFERAERARYRR